MKKANPKHVNRKTSVAAAPPTATGQGPAKPQYYAPVVITIVYDPNSGMVAVTPSFDTLAETMIHVQQKALQQTTAFAAVEQARQEAAKRTAAAPQTPSVTAPG